MPCSAYRLHRPAQPASADHHHVIPRAWQAFWRPDMSEQEKSGWSSAPVYYALAGTQPAPWDKRTVELCPNCHRSVHERIVALMRGKPAGRDKLWPIAQLALDRFTEAGGDLDALRAARLYGEQ